MTLNTRHQILSYQIPLNRHDTQLSSSNGQDTHCNTSKHKTVLPTHRTVCQTLQHSHIPLLTAFPVMRELHTRVPASLHSEETLVAVCTAVCATHRLVNLRARFRAQFPWTGGKTVLFLGLKSTFLSISEPIIHCLSPPGHSFIFILPTLTTIFIPHFSSDLFFTILILQSIPSRPTHCKVLREAA